MRKVFACSILCGGVLGGGLYVDETAVTYKTGKLTVDPKLRHLELRRDEISDITWKRVIFPIAVFKMKNGETYSFLIYSKRRFLSALQNAE